MTARFLDPNTIIVKDRYRKDMGNLKQLASDILEVGQLNPVMVEETPEGLILLQGHRRLEACKLLGRKVWVSLSSEAQVKTDNDLWRRRIELMENLSRKNFEPQEEARILAEIHKLMQEIYGEAPAGRPADGETKGWGLRDTAQLVGYRSHHPVRDALLVAKAAESGTMPELAQAHTINEASNLVRIRLKQEAQAELVRRQAARAIVENNEPRDLEKHFGDMILQGDCLTLMKGLPNAFIDYLVTDPPYGIGWSEEGSVASRDSVTRMGDMMYQDQQDEPFPAFKEYIKEIARITKPDSYLISFVGIQWFPTVFEELLKYNYLPALKPLIWVKTTEGGKLCHVGSSMPLKRPSSSYEPIIFAVRGSAEMAQSGWSDVIQYPNIAPSEKFHLSQKPIGLWQTLLEKIHHPGTSANLLDPFCGSASSLIASLRFPGITPIGMELDPKFRERAITFMIEEHLKAKGQGVPSDLEDL